MQDSGRTLTILHTAANLFRFISVVFEPFMPGFALKLNYLLGESHKPFHLVLLQVLRESCGHRFADVVLSLV